MANWFILSAIGHPEVIYEIVDWVIIEKYFYLILENGFDLVSKAGPEIHCLKVIDILNLLF